MTKQKTESNTKELLTEGEIKKLIDVADNPRDKAFISTLYETGCRIGEFLSLKIKDSSFDKEGSILRVNGKTGLRMVRSIASAPYLAAWLLAHKEKDNPEARLWTIKEVAVRLLLKRLAKKAGIKKAIDAHSLRCARAVHLSAYLTECKMKEYLEWAQKSPADSIYMRLSGRNRDEALLEAYNLKKKQ
jgi:integrase